MKLLFLFIAFVNLLLACTGDCLSCHPKLIATIEQDLRHKPMLTCINCHSANPDSMAECGSDCFGCHPMAKIYATKIPEHDVIQSCRDCHVGAIEKLFDTSKTFDQSKDESLKEFLLR